MKKTNVAAVKEFWEKQANDFKDSELATAPDHYYRQLEIDRILTYLPDKKSTVLDVGCGNGYSTIRLAHARKHVSIMGVDYSETMIAHANAALAKEKGLSDRLHFVTANALTLSKTPELLKKKFDYIVSERCLINVANWNEQRLALLEMKRLLKPRGKIILVENTQEGLDRLNKLRAKFDLKPISVRWHNFYFPEKKFLPFAKKTFRLVSAENIGNLYYILSRVLYATLAEREGVQPDYMHPINEIASRLPSLGEYSYSPNFVFVLQNR